MYKNLSPLVASQYYTETSNSRIPHVIVVSADGNELIGSVSGLDAREASGFKELKLAADAYIEDGTLIEQPEILKWFSTAKGVSYRWPILGLTDSGIIIGEGKNNKQVRAFTEMQPGGVKFAKIYGKAIEEKKFGEALEEVRKDFIFPESEMR